MKKIRPVIAFMVTIIVVTGYPKSAAGQIEGIWNGSLNMYEKFVGITGTSEKRIDVVITNNKCWGTITYHDEGGGPIKGQTACHGEGEVELVMISINHNDSLYTIETQGPTCSAGPNPWETGHGNDIQVLDHHLSNANRLSGSETTVAQIPGNLGSVATTLTWNLSQGPLDAELIVTPINYDNWLPEPGLSELKKGSLMEISLKVQGRNGGRSSIKAARFEIRLSNTSVEPGITLNAPLSPSADQLPDLRLLPLSMAESDKKDQFLAMDCKDGSTGKVYIGSYDGGGFTTLTAIAVMNDSSTIEGHLLVSGGKTEIPIPKRDGTMIGKAWLDAHGNPGDFDDKDSSRGNNHYGDGLTAYEEYRGVISEGNFKRLDPKKKELGITMQRSLLGEFAEGLNWFEIGSDIKIVRFYIHEIEADRKFNRNYSDGHVYDQYVLKLNKGNLPQNKAGKAFTTSGKPEIPAKTTQVVVSIDNIRQNFQNWSGWARSNNLQLPWTQKEYVAQTIAHELGHAVKVSHHGDDANVPQGETAQQGSGPIYHIFDRNAVEITNRPYTIEVNDQVCPANGSQASGDLYCVMAYIDVCEWARIVYADGSIGLFRSPLLPIGKNFCTKKDGTSINAGSHTVSGVAYNNYFGKAANGNCLGQITLK